LSNPNISIKTRKATWWTPISLCGSFLLDILFMVIIILNRIKWYD